MVYGQVNPSRPVSAGLPVPLPQAFSDPPFMDLEYGDLRVAERMSLAEANSFGIVLDFQYISGSGAASPQTEFGQGRYLMHRQYISSSTTNSEATVIRADNASYQFQLSGGAYSPTGSGSSTTSLAFDGTRFTEYYGDGTRLVYEPQVNSGNPVTCQLVNLFDQHGNSTTLNYGTGALQGLLTSVQLPNANVITLNYMPGPTGYPVSLLQSVEDFGARLTTYGYDNGGCMTTLTYPSGCVKVYGYTTGSTVSLLNSVTTPQGYTSNYGT